MVSMRSLGVVLRGAQQPRVEHVASFESSTGREAVELAAMAGVVADPWQEHVIHRALGEKADGRGSSFEVGVEVPRQNGKGGVLEIRELAGLFLLGEELIPHSAHEFATAEQALERMSEIIEGCPDLSRRVRTIKRSHGQEGVYLKSGQQLRYKTRTKGGGRGFSADCVILDEAMILPEAFVGALMPVLSARPNPQLWYTGSAVDMQHMEHGIVFARLRERALKGEDPAMSYFGWSPPFDSPEDLPEDAAADPDVWAVANPALGIRIPLEHIEKEHRSMDPRTFAVERLGVGAWPSGDGSVSVIDMQAWADLAVDVSSQIVGSVCVALDVTPDRSHAAVGVAGQRSDGLHQIEVVDHRRGTGWVVERLVEIQSRQPVIAVVVDAAGPAGSLISDLEAAGVLVTTVSAKEHAQACGRLYDGVAQQTFRHLGQSELNAAVKGAAKRPLGDAWAWSRKSSGVDISPLVACTLALWGSADGSFVGGFEWD